MNRTSIDPAELETAAFLCYHRCIRADRNVSDRARLRIDPFSRPDRERVGSGKFSSRSRRVGSGRVYQAVIGARPCCNMCLAV